MNRTSDFRASILFASKLKSRHLKNYAFAVGFLGGCIGVLVVEIVLSIVGQ